MLRCWVLKKKKKCQPHNITESDFEETFVRSEKSDWKIVGLSHIINLYIINIISYFFLDHKLNILLCFFFENVASRFNLGMNRTK